MDLCLTSVTLSVCFGLRWHHHVEKNCPVQAVTIPGWDFILNQENHFASFQAEPVKLSDLLKRLVTSMQLCFADCPAQCSSGWRVVYVAPETVKKSRGLAVSFVHWQACEMFQLATVAQQVSGFFFIFFEQRLQDLRACRYVTERGY